MSQNSLKIIILNFARVRPRSNWLKIVKGPKIVNFVIFRNLVIPLRLYLQSIDLKTL